MRQGSAASASMDYKLCLWIGISHVNAARQEIALDAVGVADAYLDVVLLGKASIGIEWAALPENTTHGVVWVFISVAVNLMSSLNDGAIKFANEFVC